MDICFSGGAKGADSVWGLAALELGHQVVHYSFVGHKPGTRENIRILNDTELKEADVYLQKAAIFLKRKLPYKKPWIMNLLRRNWYQVRDTNKVYAVSGLSPFSKSRSGVDGGTAWAIEMALNLKVSEIFVFDQKQNHWNQWNYLPDGHGKWIYIEFPPKPTGKWTGIGSRDLSDKGFEAIVSVFN